MTIAPLARSLIAAGAALARDDGAGFIAAFRAHDWKTVAVDLSEAELTLAAAAGVPGAGLALKLLPLGIYMARHPADPADPAMTKAAGAGGGETWRKGAHSIDTGAI